MVGDELLEKRPLGTAPRPQTTDGKCPHGDRRDNTGGEFEGTMSIAERTGAPANYLGKLLQTLARAGILRSQKGLHGGFRLARKPADITVFDIVEPIDRVSRWSGCFMGQSVCSEDKPCPIHERWAKVRDQYLRMLDECTVADLVERARALHQAG